MTHGHYIEDLEEGMSASFKKTFNHEEVEIFSQLSGDTNPVHLDENFAKETIFKERIVHGALTTSLISKVLGTQLPGPGAIFIEQNCRFLAPVMLGDEVEAVVRIENIDREKRRAFFTTECLVKGKPVVKGSATILVDRRSK